PARRRFVADDLHATPYVRDRHRAAVSASLEYRLAFVSTRGGDDDRDHASPSWGDGNTLYYTVNIGEPDPEDTTEYAIVAADRQAGEADADDG
ncbi:hypothetical protein BRC69_03645, partial [Halobacteriales archaeon QH_6_66_25]